MQEGRKILGGTGKLFPGFLLSCIPKIKSWMLASVHAAAPELPERQNTSFGCGWWPRRVLRVLEGDSHGWVAIPRVKEISSPAVSSVSHVRHRAGFHGRAWKPILRRGASPLLLRQIFLHGVFVHFDPQAGPGGNFHAAVFHFERLAQELVAER